MTNADIRLEARNHGVKLWRVAEQLGMSDSSFSRYLRHELPDSNKEQVREIIRNLSAASGEKRAVAGMHE